MRIRWLHNSVADLAYLSEHRQNKLCKTPLDLLYTAWLVHNQCTVRKTWTAAVRIICHTSVLQSEVQIDAALLWMSHPSPHVLPHACHIACTHTMPNPHQLLQVLTEGANMPSSSDAIELMHEKKIEYGPAKAANAGAQSCCKL